MQFYTRLAVLCLFAGVSTSALGQATNAPTTSPTLTPEAEKRARQLLESFGQGTPAAPTLQEREAARKRAEAEAKQRLEEQKKKQAAPALAAPAAAQPTVEGDREQLSVRLGGRAKLQPALRRIKVMRVRRFYWGF